MLIESYKISTLNLCKPWQVLWWLLICPDTLYFQIYHCNQVIDFSQQILPASMKESKSRGYLANNKTGVTQDWLCQMQNQSTTYILNLCVFVLMLYIKSWPTCMYV